MKWSIITDSSCEYTGEDTKELVFDKVPFVITIDGDDYVDDDKVDVSEMVEKMEKSTGESFTSCPSPGNWYEKFKAAELSIAITISSGVSGSYNSAVIARDMILEKYPQKRICVIDSLSAGPGQSILAKRTEELINLGKTFEEIAKELEKCVEKTNTVFALSSFNNLIKSGRMNKLVGVIVGKLGIWGIGGVSEHGKLITKSKARGPIKMMNTVIEDMKENGYNGGEVMITHCQNQQLAEKLKERIAEIWEVAHVTVISAGGLCSYYAERGGLIIAY